MNLEKTYKIPADIFREGYREYQKKYVYPKSYVFMGLFLVLAANFVYGAVKAPDNFLAYLLIVVCLAMAFREWYNPRKTREAVMESVHEMGNPLYKLTVTDDALEFSTVQNGDVENPDSDSTEPDDLPQPTRLSRDQDLKILEYDRFFLAVYGKIMFYIIPKADLSEDEMKALREINL